MRIGIVGGSIGGLAAAGELMRLGLDVVVFERSTADLADRGAGIALDPVIAEKVGLEQGARITGRVIIGASGRELWRRPAAKVVTSWVEVYQALRARVPRERIHNGRHVVACREVFDGVVLEFSDGQEMVFDLAVGADGVGSVVREAVAPGFEPQYCGYVAVRGLTPEENLPPSCDTLRRLADEPGLVNCYGPRTHLVAYWVPQGDGRALNWMWYRNQPLGELDLAHGDGPGAKRRWSMPPGSMRPEAAHALLEEMRAIFPESVYQAARATPALSLQAIYRGVAPTQVRGRVILLGDAAHVAVPHIGAGVSLAVRDAAELARLWDEDDVEASIRSWAASRRSEASRNLEAAAALGRSLQHEDHDWESWEPRDFDRWWSEIVAGSGLYFETPLSASR